MLRVYIGYDPRQPISYNVLQFSILRRASLPVSVTPLNIETLPIKRMGLTPFTFTRYLVPWLVREQMFEGGGSDAGDPGLALFLDSDMLVLGDIAELFAVHGNRPAGEADNFALSVVKNRKQFEWASAILWNCGHPANEALTPEWVDSNDNNPFKFGWLAGSINSPLIGDLPAEWNHLVGYDRPRTDAKLIHYTMGVPCFEETNMCEYAEAWLKEHQLMNGAVPWASLMGNSVHATHLPDGRILPHFHPDVLAAKNATLAEQGATE